MQFNTTTHDVEKSAGAALLLANQDVDSLAWQNLSVTIKDRISGQDRDILHKSSGLIRPGQMLALMGPSGSGKTTLLNTLAQRQKATSGRVLINGQTCPLPVHRVVTSFVEQEDVLVGSLTVAETLDFTARLALPPSISPLQRCERVTALIDAFGLAHQRDTIVGTPLQKGLSGGQKRRVSIATQLVTAPRILYLDEPTSGLDSTASFEVMSFIRNMVAQKNLIVVASIHQPSTKTFNLFSTVMLMSQGKTCYYGPVDSVSSYFRDLDMPIPELVNPAEHMLDLTSVDFGDGHDLDAIARLSERWQESPLACQLEADLNTLPDQSFHLARPFKGPPFVSQVITLLYRNFVKSYRDLVAYWVRLVMYMGLAIMMGTVWLRLSASQDDIQPFVNAIFFGSAFMSFMAVAYVPAFLEDRSTFVKERANGLCGPTAFLIANFLIGLLYLFLIAILFSVVSYWLINFRPAGVAFVTWVMWLFLDLVAAESLVVLMASLFPNFVAALALTAFANGLWMSVGGFLVSRPALNAFWKYCFHYIDYQAYVFQGMMVNEFKKRNYSCGPAPCYCRYQSTLIDECQIEGRAVLHEYGYALGKEGQWVGILIAIIFVYRFLGWGVTYMRRT